MNNIISMSVQSEKLKAALAYANLGWHVFPCWQIKDGSCACGSSFCKSPGKHPISSVVPKGQNDATTDPTIIQHWWNKYPDANIAVYLGKSGLCAVDIDPRNGGDYTIDDLEHRHGKINAEVVALTGGGGEHRIFQKPEGNLPGKLGKGVDLKLNGYIIVEPSNHLSGANYCWEFESSPFDGAIPSPLPDWIRSLESQPQQAQDGHDVANPIVSFEQIDDLMQALLFINSDERETWLTVGMALHGTGDSRAYEWWCNWSQESTKFNHKDQYRVWRSFRFKGFDGVGLPTVFAMAAKNGWVNKSTPEIKPVAIVDAVKEEPEAIKQAHTPERLLHLPVRNLEAVAYWMEGFSEEPQRQITVQATLALASVLAGRIYRSTLNNTSNTYYLTLAGTGIGKNYVKTAIRKLIAECGQSDLLSGSGNTSAGAVFSALFEAPNHIQITDEFGKQLQMARKQSNGAMSDAFAVMTEAYSDSTGILVPRNYSSFHLDKKQRAQIDKKIVHAPSITMFAFAAPEQVFNNLSTVEIDDGYLNRFIVVQAELPPHDERDIIIVDLPDELKNWIKSIRNRQIEGTDLTGINTDYDQEPKPVAVEFSDTARALFNDFKQEIKRNESANVYTEPKLVRRWRENSMRIATALAVCDAPDQPLITENIARWAIDYVRFYGEQFMHAVSTNVADSDFHRLYLAVKKVVESAGRKGATEREIARASRLFASTAPHHRDQAINALIREQLIQLVSIKPAGGRGKMRTAYLSAEYVEVSEND